MVILYLFFREASYVKNDVFLSNDLELCFARMDLSKLNYDNVVLSRFFYLLNLRVTCSSYEMV